MITIERAIEILTPGNICRNTAEYEEAHIMAVKALEEKKNREGKRRSKKCREEK